MNRLNIELAVGVFLIAGLAGFFYLAIKMGDIGLFEQQRYSVDARFTSSSGLKAGAFVELAGVPIGKVSSIRLDPSSYESVVELSIPETVKLQVDSIASIRTAGIIGDKFVKLSPGGAGKLLPNGGRIRDTESAVEWEELISQYIHGKV